MKRSECRSNIRYPGYIDLNRPLCDRPTSRSTLNRAMQVWRFEGRAMAASADFPWFFEPSNVRLSSYFGG